MDEKLTTILCEGLQKRKGTCDCDGEGVVCDALKMMEEELLSRFILVEKEKGRGR